MSHHACANIDLPDVLSNEKAVPAQMTGSLEFPVSFCFLVGSTTHSCFSAYVALRFANRFVGASSSIGSFNEHERGTRARLCGPWKMARKCSWHGLPHFWVGYLPVDSYQSFETSVLS